VNLPIVKIRWIFQVNLFYLNVWQEVFVLSRLLLQLTLCILGCEKVYNWFFSATDHCGSFVLVVFGRRLINLFTHFKFILRFFP